MSAHSGRWRNGLVLTRYLNRSLLTRFLICGAVLVSLLEILGLLDKATDILDRGLGVRGILTYSVLHLPALSVEIVPLAFMIGAMFLLTQMSLTNEISALRAAGLSTAALYRRLLPAIAAVGLLTTAAQYWLVPPCEEALATWWNRTDPHAADDALDADPDARPAQALWFRSGPVLVRIGRYAKAGAFLRDVTIYHRDRDGILTGVEHADTLTFTGGGWVAGGGKDMALSADRTRAAVTTGDDRFPIMATPPMIMRLSEESAHLTPGQIEAVLHDAAPAAHPRASYAMALFGGAFVPLQIAVMLLLALPVIYIPPRAGLRNPLPVYTLAAGMGFVILNGIISALGNAGSIAAPLAAGAGSLVGALLGLTWLARMEER